MSRGPSHLTAPRAKRSIETRSAAPTSRVVVRRGSMSILTPSSVMARSGARPRRCGLLHRPQRPASSIWKKNSGTSLFDRLQSGVRLTAAGEAFAAHVRRTLGDLHRFGDQIRNCRV